jgi:hypothetical protein
VACRRRYEVTWEEEVTNPLKVKPRNDWCLILEDPTSDTIGSSGLIVRVGDYKEEKLAEGVGTIVRLGNTKRTDAMGLREGLRVAYRGYLKHANSLETEEVWHGTTKKKYFLMSCEDIVGEVDSGTGIGVFGRPSTHAIEAGAFDAPEGK